MASPPPIQSRMKSLAVPSFRDPADFTVLDLPVPRISRPDHILIKVHAASINPTDIALARGAFKLAVKIPFPIKIGYDVSGTIEAIGDSVTVFKVGDEVFCCLPWEDRGGISEYALTTTNFIVSKPSNLSHVAAASLPLVSLTSLQSFEKISLLSSGEEFAGKTVLIPAGRKHLSVSDLYILQFITTENKPPNMCDVAK